jgi:hypothetical protein
VIADHVETMLQDARARLPLGFGLPRYVERSFDRYLACGRLDRGFAPSRKLAVGCVDECAPGVADQLTADARHQPGMHRHLLRSGSGRSRMQITDNSSRRRRLGRVAA